MVSGVSRLISIELVYVAPGVHAPLAEWHHRIAAPVVPSVIVVLGGKVPVAGVITGVAVVGPYAYTTASHNPAVQITVQT
jgi:hypothetical protein